MNLLNLSETNRQFDEMTDYELYDYLEVLTYENPFLAEKMVGFLQTALQELDKRLNKTLKG